MDLRNLVLSIIVHFFSLNLYITYVYHKTNIACSLKINHIDHLIKPNYKSFYVQTIYDFGPT